MDATIRVSLEPDYDHGRTGAWMLDWPGCFCWGESRAAALARVPSAVAGHIDWLADHGLELPTPPPDIEMVEEVAAFRLEGGYEVNATFAVDQRQVTADELETAIRILGYAREDLTTLASQVKAFLAHGGVLPAEHRAPEPGAIGTTDGRQVDDVLHHIAGAETWFVSRLDPAARYDGPRDDLSAYLEASRLFLIAGLRALWATDPHLARTDSKGESWTLAKVLRRAIYHSRDHLEELDRRLARAEGRVDRLEIHHDAPIDPGELRRLFRAAGLARRALDDDDVTAHMLAGSTETVSAMDGERLVGFARIISDEATNGYISTVAVAPRWQDRGLGRRLMDELMDGREALKLTLDARDGVQQFYERLGFRKVDTVLVRPRIAPTEGSRQ